LDRKRYRNLTRLILAASQAIEDILLEVLKVLRDPQYVNDSGDLIAFVEESLENTRGNYEFFKNCLDSAGVEPAPTADPKYC
jgi:hypothetical protein